MAYLRRLGFAQDGQTAVGTGLQANTCLGQSPASRTLRRFEFDGEIPSDILPKEQGALVQETMPGSIVHRTYNGLLGIYVPDPDTAVERQIQGTINDAKIAFWDYPRADDVVSRLNVKFKDANQDLRETTATYPKPRSALANQLEALEGEPQSLEFDLEGVVNPYLAHSVAVNYVLMSHRKVGRIVCQVDDWRYEVGDKVRFIDEEEGVNDVVVITHRQEVGQNVVFDIMQYRNIDYSYQPKEVETAGLPPTTDLTVPVPSSLTLSRGRKLAEVRVDHRQRSQTSAATRSRSITAKVGLKWPARETPL